MGRLYANLGHESSLAARLALIVVLVVLLHLAVKAIRMSREWLIDKNHAQKSPLDLVVPQPKVATLIRLVTNGLIFAMNDSGKLSLFEASTAKYNLLAQAQVLKGHESWGPMALAGGRLLVRDLTRLACLDVAGK